MDCVPLYGAYKKQYDFLKEILTGEPPEKYESAEGIMEGMMYRTIAQDVATSFLPEEFLEMFGMENWAKKEDTKR